mgnify:CR=1 FL=1
MNSLFVCPLCGGALVRQDGAYRCPAGHSFDIAREGHTYLLPVNRKHSKAPGDDKAMAAARSECSSCTFRSSWAIPGPKHFSPQNSRTVRLYVIFSSMPLLYQLPGSPSTLTQPQKRVILGKTARNRGAFMKILIRGAGDIATGIALRLYRAGMQVVMTDLPAPTAIRRTVCFSQAIILGEMTVEDVTARRAETSDQAEALLAQGLIPMLADPDCTCRTRLRPDALVDAILAKRNLGTKMDDAPIVVGIGPGFTAGEDCHAVVETMRGHTLGRVIYSGSALPNTYRYLSAVMTALQHRNHRITAANIAAAAAP